MPWICMEAGPMTKRNREVDLMINWDVGREAMIKREVDPMIK